MSTPTVTEIAPRPEPVAHDTFIDDLRPRRELQAEPRRGEPPSKP